MTILTLWTALAPWKWDRVVGVGKDEYGRETQTYGTCASDKETLAKGFGSLLAIVNVIPIFVSVYQSFRGRKLPSEFNESRFLSMSVASLLETFLVGLPITLTSWEPTVVFITRAIVLCMACLAILLPMFVPKWRRTKSRGSEPSIRRVPVVSGASSTLYSEEHTSEITSSSLHKSSRFSK